VTERLDVDGIDLTRAPGMMPFYESAGFRRGTAMAKPRSPVADGAWALAHGVRPPMDVR
jgi:hypothetical protein